MRSALLCVAVTLLIACQSSTTGDGFATSASATSTATGAAPAAMTANAVVDRVVDGDTIVVHIDGTRERVRLIGIDTPETVKPNSPVECFGPEASAFTKSLLPAGTAVRIVRDVEARDAYDRLLGYVYVAADGTFVNLELARQGYAQLLTFPPNVSHVDEFRDAVAAARRDGRGLWASCDG